MQRLTKERIFLGTPNSLTATSTAERAGLTAADKSLFQKVTEIEIDGKRPCPGWNSRVPFTSPSPGKPIARAIVTWRLPPKTFCTPTIQFPPILIALKAVPPQAQHEKSQGLSYLSESAAESRGNRWRIESSILYSMSWGGMTAGWDKDTALASLHMSV